MPAVSSEIVGDQGDGHQPSLVSEAGDAISHLQVAKEASQESMDLVVGGEENLSEQVSSQTLEPTEETSSSTSSSDSCKGSDEGGSAGSSGADVGSTPTAVPRMEEFGDRGNGLTPSLVTDAEDGVAGGAAGEASSQAPGLTDDDDAVSSPAEKGSVGGDGSATGESEDSCNEEDTRDERPRRQLGGSQARRRCTPIAHGG